MQVCMRVCIVGVCGCVLWVCIVGVYVGVGVGVCVWVCMWVCVGVCVGVYVSTIK